MLYNYDKWVKGYCLIKNEDLRKNESNIYKKIGPLFLGLVDLS